MTTDGYPAHIIDAALARPTSPGVTWTVTVTAPCDWLNLNGREHWGRKAGRARSWRHATLAALRAAHLPTGLDRIRVDAELRFAARRRRRDPSNFMPTIKPMVDALCPAQRTTRGVAVGYGLIPDDNPAHLDGPHLTIGEPIEKKPYGPVGEVILTITVLEAVAA